MYIAPSHRKLFLIETAAGLFWGIAVTLAFYYCLFGGLEIVPVRSKLGLAADFIPQSFMIAFMASIIPGYKLRSKVRGGAVERLGHGKPMPVFYQSALAGLISMLLAGFGTAAPLWFFCPTGIYYGWALVIKVVVATLIAIVAAPIAMRNAVLGTASTGDPTLIGD